MNGRFGAILVVLSMLLWVPLPVVPFLSLDVADRARLVLSDIEQIRAVARRSSNPADGVLRLGLFPTLAPYFLPHVVPPVRKRYPNLRLQLSEEKTEVILRMLRQGQLDGGIEDAVGPVSQWVWFGQLDAQVNHSVHVGPLDEHLIDRLGAFGLIDERRKRILLARGPQDGGRAGRRPRPSGRERADRRRDAAGRRGYDTGASARARAQG